MERYKLRTVLLTDEDVRVFMESLQHSSQREELPEEDRARLSDLRERLGDRFKFEE